MSSPLAEAFLLVTLNNCYETPSKKFIYAVRQVSEPFRLDDAFRLYDA